MAGSIKGIIVEIGGDTSGLQKALKSVNSATASLSKELRGINSLLKLDPKNTELLAQKQTVLKESISQTTKGLEQLKKAQQMYVESGGELNSAEYRKLQREIIYTEQRLKDLNNEASKWTQMSQTLGNLGSKMKSFGDAISDVGSKVSILSAAVGSLFAAGVNVNMEMEKNIKIFELFTGSTEEAQKAVDNLREDAKTSIFSANDLINANRYLLAAGLSAEEARKDINNLANALAAAGGDASQLSNMAYNMGQVRSNAKAAAIDMRQFSNTGIPIWQLLSDYTGKTREELEKTGVTYDMIAGTLEAAAQDTGRLSGAMERLAETTSGKFTKMKGTFQEALGNLTESLLPTINDLLEKIIDKINQFNNLPQETKDLITKIGLVIIALGPVLVIVGKLISFGGTLISAISTIAGLIGGAGGLSAILAALTGPIGIVLAAIAALVAGFTLLWNKSETFRNSIREIGQSLVQTYNEHIKPIIDNVTEILSILWNDLIVPYAQYLWEKFGPIIEKVFTMAGKIIVGVFDKVASIIHTATDILKGLIKFITGVFTADWGQAWEGIKEIFGSVFNGLKSLFTTPINWIIGKLNKFIDSINNIKIPDWVPEVGGKGIHIAHIPQLAEGGIIDKATLAMIGEGKSAEAVIPLDRTLSRYMAEAMRQAGGSNNQIVVNFYPQQMTNAELDNAFNYINRRFGLAY